MFLWNELSVRKEETVMLTLSLNSGPLALYSCWRYVRVFFILIRLGLLKDPMLKQDPGSPYLSPSPAPNTSCQESNVCSNYVLSTVPSPGIYCSVKSPLALSVWFPSYISIVTGLKGQQPFSSLKVDILPLVYLRNKLFLLCFWTLSFLPAWI